MGDPNRETVPFWAAAGRPSFSSVWICLPRWSRSGPPSPPDGWSGPTRKRRFGARPLQSDRRGRRCGRTRRRPPAEQGVRRGLPGRDIPERRKRFCPGSPWWAGEYWREAVRSRGAGRRPGSPAGERCCTIPAPPPAGAPRRWAAATGPGRLSSAVRACSNRQYTRCGAR